MSRKIFINPGHFPGADPGCGNRAFNVHEADYVKEIGALLVNELMKFGYHDVRCLQTDNLRNGWDDDKSQLCIVDEANKWNSDIAVSIHCNAFNGEAHGTECICFARGSDAERLALLIQNNLVEVLETYDRGIKYEEDKPRDKRLSFCMKTDMPAVIVECAFLDNFDDAVVLIENKEEIAKAICRGIIDYFEV